MPAERPAEGVLLMAFGGPESLEEVPEFVTRLTGRELPPRVMAAVVERYRLVGGRSPLPETTRAQARALAAELARRGRNIPVWAGFQFSRPGLAEALAGLAGLGVRRVAALSLAPYRSQHSTAVYEETVRQALPRVTPEVEVRFAPDWYVHPRYLDSLEQELRTGLTQAALLAEAPPGAGAGAPEIPVIFSAHSLPLAYVEKGDPYPDQVHATAQALADRLGLRRWRVAYQSKGASGGEWLGPEVEEVLEQLAEEGARVVVVDPIGFTADHLETLYDNDVVHRRKAESLGMRFVRCSCPNTAPAFIAALADLAEATLGG